MPPFKTEESRSLLDALMAVGTIAVVDCPETPLGAFFTAELKSVTSLAIYQACSQKPNDPALADAGCSARSTHGGARRR